MHRPRMIVLAVVLASSAGTALADDEVARQEVGAGTRAWTDLQKNGSSASTVERPMPGDVATNVYQRYADSFKHPIPEKYDREAFSSNEGGGGSK